jgi:hypothetical protein
VSSKQHFLLGIRADEDENDTVVDIRIHTKTSKTRDLFCENLSILGGMKLHSKSVTLSLSALGHDAFRGSLHSTLSLLMLLLLLHAN